MSSSLKQILEMKQQLDKQWPLSKKADQLIDLIRVHDTLLLNLLAGVNINRNIDFEKIKDKRKQINDLLS